MAQNITLLGANYSAVPAVTLPKTGGGTASFDDTTDATATADKILSGYTAYANGVKLTGTATVPSGEDIPVFTINLSTNPPTATCNKTFAECETLLNANNTNAIAYAPSVSTKVPMAVHNYVSNYEIVYAIYDAYGYPMADIAYFNGGTVSYYEPSTLNNSLPTQPSSTHTGTLKATIDRSTSERYLNIAKGYYPSDAYYTLSAVPNGTAGTPSATKGTVSNHSISVTPSVTNTTGYITGSTKTGTAVSVSASELVSGTKSITENGTGIDVTNYANVNVSVSGGLVYETGTWTPSEDVAEAWISFANTHTEAPFFYSIIATEYTNSDGSNGGTDYINYAQIIGEPFRIGTSTSSVRYGAARKLIRSGGSTQSSITHPHTNTGDSTTGYSRYWAKETGIRAAQYSSGYYWRAGITYKWAAVWAPTT